MKVTQPPPSKERNPVTRQKHRQEVLWQILFPLLIGIVVALILGGLSVSNVINQSRLADISLIWLILPNIFVALIAIILLAGMVYGVIKLIAVLPVFAYKAQNFFGQIQFQVGKIDDKIVEPVLKARATYASWRKLKEQIFRR